MDVVSIAESDLDSISDLLKYEPPTKPPTVDQVLESTHWQFSKKWIKYIYAMFKSECPNGRMRFPEFKKLLSFYLPDRVSDAYLERMFKAICYNTVNKETITFKDLIETLALLHSNDPKINAEWTFRLINPKSYDKITFNEFHEFVKSVFLLTGREKRARVDSILSDYRMDNSTTCGIKKRASFIFHQLDSSGKGFITIQDLERNFYSQPFIFVHSNREK
ncbi:hypothetical protein FO519_004243 [Halicephalobus sp. NKZ332]|nr:hypothetical protein FO519_004243 [Halicephalobus sp. NKZ332]